MGSGKSTLGKQLALEINYSFIDLDKKIEFEEEKSISEIFLSKGEDTFRKLEHQVLQKCISEHKNTVIATGGGTPCFYNNIELMQKNGIVVYLKLNVTYLQQRISNSKKIRPLIPTKNEEKQLEWINQTLAQREVFYNKAHLIVDALNIQASTLLKYLSNFEQFDIK